MTYVGRFAPSPTGPLHIGSLVTAVASYLHARQAHGRWLVRIEDIDPPREVAGAADGILRTLEAFDLDWDGSVLWQSSRFEVYRAVAEQLLKERLAFRCRCSRSDIRAATPDASSPHYPGTCRELGITASDTAIRMRVDSTPIVVTDELQGRHETDLAMHGGDYVVVRRDALPAYHLAVVIDDADQGITTVVRGVDLLDSTANHVHLQRQLNLPTPRYLHVPVVVNAEGQKLSKQTGASPIEVGSPAMATLLLRLLGLEVPPELIGERPSTLWQWAQSRWNSAALRGVQTLRPQ